MIKAGSRINNPASKPINNPLAEDINASPISTDSTSGDAIPEDPRALNALCILITPLRIPTAGAQRVITPPRIIIHLTTGFIFLVLNVEVTGQALSAACGSGMFVF